MDPSPERDRALTTALASIEKQFGHGTVMRLGDGTAEKVAVIPSGSLALDLATGVGGYPRGRVVEIFGPESSGKTTLALHAIASCHAAGGVAAFIDAEHALDPTYAAALGVRMHELLVSQPDNGEQALEVVDALVHSGAVDLIVVDSVAALVPKAEIEGEMGDAQMGLQARLMSQALRKLTGVASRTRTTVVFINQLRQKIGVTFGPSETTCGGNALKFYASLRIDIRRIGSIKKGEADIGNRVRVKIVKNKLAPPFRQFETDLLFGSGISVAGELLDIGESIGVLTRRGAWIDWGTGVLGNGREAARSFLAHDPVARERLQAAIMATGRAA